MKIWRIVVLPVLVLALAASGTQVAQADARAKTLVDLREQGGFAGIDNRVIVRADGCARYSRRTGPAVRLCMTAKELRQLRGYLKHLKLGKSESMPPGADFIKYTLAYKGHRASRYTLPATWTPVVRHLEKLLTKYWAPD
jgi:hypothetical protein